MINAPEQPDRIRQYFIQFLHWATLPATLHKLAGAVSSIFLASMLQSIWYVGPILSSSTVMLGLISLNKLAKNNGSANLPPMTQSEKYTVLLLGASGLFLSVLSPPLFSGYMILTSGALGYFYIQDLVLSPLGKSNEVLQNTMRNFKNTDECKAAIENLLRNGANPYLNLELDQNNDWILNEQGNLLCQNVDKPALTAFLNMQINAQNQNLSFFSTLKKMIRAFKNNAELFDNLHALLPHSEQNVNTFANALFQTSHELLNSFIKALSSWNIFLRTLAPNEYYFDNATNISELTDTLSDKLSSTLKDPRVQDFSKTFATAFSARENPPQQTAEVVGEGNDLSTGNTPKPKPP